MAYKLIAVDLDDTLLDAEKQVSPTNRAAIRRALDAGVHVVLASGRAYDSVKKYNKELGIHDYTIAAAGGQVVDKDGKTVYSTFLPPLAAKQVMRWAKTRGIHFHVYLEDGFHYLSKNKFSDFYEAQGNLNGIEDPGLMEIDAPLATKILFVDTPGKIQEYKREAVAAFPELMILTSQLEFLEFFSPETSKGGALEFVARQLGVEKQQIIAIGDSEIDLAMLRYAGLGVAMANAHPPVLEAADVVTGAVGEDGVAQVIEKYIK